LSLLTIVLDRKDLLLPLSTSIVFVIVLFPAFLWLLFIHYVFITIGKVIQIYVCYNNLYAHRSPQESMVRGSEAQTVDSNLRVLAPGFRSSASP